MRILMRSFLLMLYVVYISADDIEVELQSGTLYKMLREMVNQTKADSMNLPSNATSIRENITDTFSCENRTYGYYADVDNECQIFHVCLPSQTISGRNITYRWSFICPAETVFNQEVLTCTRPRDAILCEDSPLYYDINMEFGKVSNNSKENQVESANSESAPMSNPAPNNEEVASSPQRWNQANRKKQNVIVQTLFKDVASNTKAIKEDIKEYNKKIMDSLKQEIKNNNYDMVQTINKDFGLFNHGMQELKEEVKEIEKEIVNLSDDIKYSDKEKTQEIMDNVKEIVNYKKEELINANLKSSNFNEREQSLTENVKPYNTETLDNVESANLPQSVLKKIENMNAETIAPMVVEEIFPDVQEENKEDPAAEEFDNSRIASERSLKRTGRKIYRGSLKFRSEAL